MEKNSNFSSDAELLEWQCFIIHEKGNIRCKKLNPAQTLMQVFDLCIDNFDENNLLDKHPKLYNTLFTLYQADKKFPLIDSLEKNISLIFELLDIFKSDSSQICRIDSELYYALLNFIDLLKTKEGKRIYYRNPKIEA